jgi:hypothetical protein
MKNLFIQMMFFKNHFLLCECQREKIKFSVGGDFFAYAMVSLCFLKGNFFKRQLRHKKISRKKMMMTGKIFLPSPSSGGKKELLMFRE